MDIAIVVPPESYVIRGVIRAKYAKIFAMARIYAL